MSALALITMVMLALPWQVARIVQKCSLRKLRCAPDKTSGGKWYRLQTKRCDKRVTDKAASLIYSAKFAREHLKFMACLDKSGYAI